MNITKYLHSCLVIEEQGKTFLLDPGNYSFDSFNFDALKKLDYILITHEHPDHMHLPFIQKLLTVFPNTPIISNESVHQILEKENISVQTTGNEFVHITLVNHERVFDREPPLNVMFNIMNKLTDPGDSISFEKTKDILALPLLGPSWMITQAVEKALEVKPKIILPIHDWHWKDSFREAMYDRLEHYFETYSIRFLKPELGITLTI
jgi:L-ascorbate metabolism protein UlaG (beta-lactamase superfamily)